MPTTTAERSGGYFDSGLFDSVTGRSNSFCLAQERERDSYGKLNPEPRVQVDREGCEDEDIRARSHLARPDK